MKIIDIDNSFFDGKLIEPVEIERNYYFYCLQTNLRIDNYWEEYHENFTIAPVIVNNELLIVKFKGDNYITNQFLTILKSGGSSIVSLQNDELISIFTTNKSNIKVDLDLIYETLYNIFLLCLFENSSNKVVMECDNYYLNFDTMLDYYKYEYKEDFDQYQRDYKILEFLS